MVQRTRAFLIATLLLASATVGFAQQPRYRFSVVASGLDRPVGITVEGSETVYFTLVPTPGVGGGANQLSAVTPQLSPVTGLAVARLRVHKFASVLPEKLAGQLIVGGWLSVTVTVNEQVAVRLAPSVTI